MLVGDIYQIRFTKTNGASCESKAILLAKVQDNCLWNLCFWSDKTKPPFNELEMIDGKSTQTRWIAYAEPCVPLMKETKEQDAVEYLGKLTDEGLAELVDDVINSPAQSLWQAYKVRESKMVSTFYDNFVGQYDVPGMSFSEEQYEQEEQKDDQND